MIESGRPIAEIARELGINEGTFGNWVNEWKQSNPEPEKALSAVERARVGEMEEEIRRLRMENEFLKKQRPSSPRRNRSRALRVDRCTEGQLSDRVDVLDAARAQVELQ